MCLDEHREKRYTIIKAINAIDLGKFLSRIFKPLVFVLQWDMRESRFLN